MWFNLLVCQISANETRMSHILMKSPSNLIMGGRRGKIIIFRGRRTLAEFNLNVRKDQTNENRGVWFHQSTEKIIKRIMFVKAGPVLQIGVDSGG